MKKNKKVIWILSILLVFMFAITTGVSIAWITQTGKTPDFTYEVGEINYVVQKANTPAGTIIVPGDNLGNITITNTSNIKTNLRVLIEAEVTKPAGQPIKWTVGKIGTPDLPNETNQVLITLASDWVIDPSTNYLYYKSMTDAQGIINPSTNPSSPFTNMCINGEIIGSEFEKASVKISITFQAKQAENVTWANIGAINWSTGI